MACEIAGYSCEGIGAIGSLIVAIVVFCYSIRQTYLTREHNRLSVKPELTAWEDTSIVSVPGGRETHHKAYLKNIGIGPALIESFDVYVDADRIEADGLAKIDKAVALLFPMGAPRIAHRSYLTKGGAISVNESVLLVHLVFPATTTPSQTLLEQIKKRVKLVVKYQSMYRNEVFAYDSHANHRIES